MVQNRKQSWLLVHPQKAQSNSFNIKLLIFKKTNLAAFMVTFPQEYISLDTKAISKKDTEHGMRMKERAEN